MLDRQSANIDAIDYLASWFIRVAQRQHIYLVSGSGESFGLTPAARVFGVIVVANYTYSAHRSAPLLLIARLPLRFINLLPFRSGLHLP
jgi:hypothetical protein